VSAALDPAPFSAKGGCGCCLAASIATFQRVAAPTTGSLHEAIGYKGAHAESRGTARKVPIAQGGSAREVPWIIPISTKSGTRHLEPVLG
jgi:hypothetical protein